MLRGENTASIEPVATPDISVMVQGMSGLTDEAILSRTSVQVSELKPGLVWAFRLGPQPTCRRNFVFADV
jgi:hypothetical protein